MNVDTERTGISFIIPVLNGAKFIAKCLDGIIAEMDPELDEIIVLDNGSTDGTVDIVKGFSTVRLLERPGSTIAALRNRGTKVAQGEYFGFIDSDCVIAEGWREAVESVLRDENIHATGSRYDIPQPAHWIEKAWYAKKVKAMGPINYINSGNLVVKKGAFEAVAGFDERLITDEDYDLGTRLNRAGFAVIEAPRVRAVHLGNPKSLRQFFGKEKWHATSSLNALSQGRLDRPTAMTIALMACWLAALVVLPQVIAGRLSAAVPVILLLIVPVITTAYRALQYRAYRHFPSLVVLYAVFYVARALIIAQLLFAKATGGGDSARGQISESDI
ncbi:MAG: glycosyltransferase [Candidatus Zixiibacteriota bacterium]|nr:MAG: glycosyltransferase [candidate division Zixibacteria bacterium]